MWEYLAVLLLGFWLGIAIFLYVSCYWLEEILDLPPARNEPSSASSLSSGASGAHAQLKRLVARVVEEAAALPALARYATEPSQTPSIENSTYEDLLATAILNKVIERYQTENGSGGRSSGIHSASASPTPSERSSPQSRHVRDITPPLREEDDVSDWEEGEATDDALEMPRRVPFPEFGGDIIHSTENIDRDFDEVSGSDIQAVDGTWEENWLFQKKKIKTLSSVPVPMLVPNSNTEYRALIGDRDANDTTDLSDNASDTDGEEEYKSDIKRVLDSKHVIGGKPKIDDSLDFEPDSLTILDGSDDFDKLDEEEYMQRKKLVDAVNGEIEPTIETKAEAVNGNVADKIEVDDSKLIVAMDSGPLTKAEFNLKEEIHRTVLNGTSVIYEPEPKHVQPNGDIFDDIMEHLPKNKVSLGSTNTLLSLPEREGEYEETVTMPVQRYADSLRRKHFDDEPQQIPTRDTDKEEDLIPGSIADRERKKWLNYVEMPNNPYSPEAIQKRLSTKSTASLFDMITKSKDDDVITVDVVDGTHDTDEHITKLEVNNKSDISTDSDVTRMNGTTSPSPRILKDVLAEEVPQYKRYGRDYYIKEAKASSGGRKKSVSDASTASSGHKAASLDNFDSDFPSPGLLIQQFNTIATNQHYTTFASKNQTQDILTTTFNNNKDEILIEYEDVNEQTLFSAKPVYVDDDTDKTFEEILKTAYGTDDATTNGDVTDKITEVNPKSPTTASVDNSYISTSSLEDSIKIYNIPTGEIVKSKPEDNVSQRYEAQVDGNNIDITDKNFPGEIDDTLSHDSDVDEASVIIEDKTVEDVSDEENPDVREIQEILSKLPKVKELAKKFVSMENLNESTKPHQIWRRRSRENILDENNKDKPINKQQYMHSLTARSISREFREELKMSMATPLTVPGGSKVIPEGEEVMKESSRPGSPLPEPGTIKSKLAFFESLKAKFSSK